MLWSKFDPKLTLFTTHLAGAAFGAASVVWALRFHNFFAALPWCICAVVAVPILAGAVFRRFLNRFGAAGQRRLVLASALGYVGGIVLMSVVTGAIL